MRPSLTLLCLSLTAALLVGCKKDETVATPAPEPASEAASPAPAAEPSAAAPAAAPVAARAFDINAVPVSDKPLGDWP